MSGSPNYPITRMSTSGRRIAASGMDAGEGKWSYSAALAYAAKEAASKDSSVGGTAGGLRPNSASALVPTLARKSLGQQLGGSVSLSRSSLQRLPQ